MTLITVSGYPGSGTTTVVGHLKAMLGLPSYNVGDLFRIMAAEKGMSLADLHRLAKEDRSIDRILDGKQVEVARGGDVILEGRLAGYLTYHAGLPGVRTWLRAPIPVRAERVARRESVTPTEAEEEIRVRQEAERTRYLAYYDFDLDDLSVYDLVIDSDSAIPMEIANKIADQVRDDER
jgi:predicted cytidylate kinase